MHEYVSAPDLAQSPIEYISMHAKLIASDMYNLGMNVNLGSFANKDYAFVLVCCLSLVLAIFVGFLLKKKDML